MAKKKIKMRVIDWEGSFYDNYFVKLLQDKFDIIESSEPDFLLYSAPAWECLDYDCVRIFYTGENIRTDWNIADYGIDFDFLDFEDRHFRFPLGIMTAISFKNEILNRHLMSDSQIESKSKFCAFMVSNSKPPYSDVRDNCFELLSQYKKVDSGGRFRNNVGAPVRDKIAWLKDYKFHLCFENSSYPGYLTEKLFHAYAAGCVPIYWGDTSLRIDSIESSVMWGGGGKVPKSA